MKKNEELRKQIKDAAKKSVHRQYNCKGKYPCANHKYCEMCGGHNTPYDCCECGAEDYYNGFIAGAEFGYKKAIAMVKEWLKNDSDDYVDVGSRDVWGESPFPDKEVVIADFKTYMNKLIEK